MPRPRLYDEALRQRLVECAAQAISTGGHAAMSLRTVAAAAGTTTAAVYSLFGNREGLVSAVVDEGFERLGQHLAAVARTAEPRQDLFSLGLAYRESALADPHYYRVMFGATAGDRSALGRPTFVVLRDAAARVLRRPRDAPWVHGSDDHDDDGGDTRAWAAEDLALRLWALAHGLVSLELAGLLPGSPVERARRYAAALRPAQD